MRRLRRAPARPVAAARAPPARARAATRSPKARERPRPRRRAPSARRRAGRRTQSRSLAATPLPLPANCGKVHPSRGVARCTFPQFAGGFGGVGWVGGLAGSEGDRVRRGEEVLRVVMALHGSQPGEVGAVVGRDVPPRLQVVDVAAGRDRRDAGVGRRRSSCRRRGSGEASGGRACPGTTGSSRGDGATGTRWPPGRLARAPPRSAGRGSRRPACGWPPGWRSPGPAPRRPATVIVGRTSLPAAQPWRGDVVPPPRNWTASR